MRAMQLTKPRERLHDVEVPTPQPAAGQVLVQVHTCAVCRTDLHVIDGELREPKLPLIPGHEIVGHVAALGAGTARFRRGERVGIPWLGWTCGVCAYCRSGHENLCERARFTGYTLDGGFAEFVVADERFCLRLPPGYDDASAAPLLCAGLIGYRSLRKAGEGRRLGLYGFGAAAHLTLQAARLEGKAVYAFTRPADEQGQEFARRLGAVWAGSSLDAPPDLLDAAIIFAPVGDLVPRALGVLRKGGCVVCGGIHMSDIPSFPYELLWPERTITSVANSTRQDGEAFFALAARHTFQPEVQRFSLRQANDAVEALRNGRIQGAAVLVVNAG